MKVAWQASNPFKPPFRTVDYSNSRRKLPSRGRSPLSVRERLPSFEEDEPQVRLTLSVSSSQVKFLKTKEGCAMIQMGDSIAVERCLQNLNNVTIGTDGRLQLGFSKQAFLSDVTNPYILPDKTASFKDFTGSKNNR